VSDISVRDIIPLSVNFADRIGIAYFDSIQKENIISVDTKLYHYSCYQPVNFWLLWFAHQFHLFTFCESKTAAYLGFKTSCNILKRWMLFSKEMKC